MKPLHVNPILPFLSVALVDDIFVDYHTMEEIFDIPAPLAGTVTKIRTKPELYYVPFFQTMSSEGPTGKIRKAAVAAKQLVDAGHRAGIAENLSFRATRRVALIKADGRWSLASVIFHKVLTMLEIADTHPHRE
jgi:hypothetical protein